MILQDQFTRGRTGLCACQIVALPTHLHLPAIGLTRSVDILFLLVSRIVHRVSGGSDRVARLLSGVKIRIQFERFIWQVTMANYNSIPTCEHAPPPPPYSSLNHVGSGGGGGQAHIPLTYVDFVPKRLDEGGAFTTKEFERFEYVQSVFSMLATQGCVKCDVGESRAR